MWVEIILSLFFSNDGELRLNFRHVVWREWNLRGYLELLILWRKIVLPMYEGILIFQIRGWTRHLIRSLVDEVRHPLWVPSIHFKIPTNTREITSSTLSSTTKEYLAMSILIMTWCCVAITFEFLVPKDSLWSEAAWCCETGLLTSTSWFFNLVLRSCLWWFDIWLIIL